jgi:outer membrane protein assembly factor BamB
VQSISGIERVLADGSVLWSVPERSRAPIALGAGDRVTGLEEQCYQGPLCGLYALDPGTGAVLWGNGPGMFDQYLLGPVAGADGTTLLLATTHTSGVELVAYDGHGVRTVRADLGTQLTAEASQMAVGADGTAVVLALDEQPSPGHSSASGQVVAVESTGKTKWAHPLSFSTVYNPAGVASHYNVVVDRSGTVVLTAGGIRALDGSTGGELWHLDAPNSKACLEPAVLGTDGSVYAMQCDGTLFRAKDP